MADMYDPITGEPMTQAQRGAAAKTAEQDREAELRRKAEAEVARREQERKGVSTFASESPEAYSQRVDQMAGDIQKAEASGKQAEVGATIRRHGMDQLYMDARSRMTAQSPEALAKAEQDRIAAEQARQAADVAREVERANLLNMRNKAQEAWSKKAKDDLEAGSARMAEFQRQSLDTRRRMDAVSGRPDSMQFDPVDGVYRRRTEPDVPVSADAAKAVGLLGLRMGVGMSGAAYQQAAERYGFDPNEVTDKGVATGADIMGSTVPVSELTRAMDMSKEGQQVKERLRGALGSIGDAIKEASMSDEVLADGRIDPVKLAAAAAKSGSFVPEMAPFVKELVTREAEVAQKRRDDEEKARFEQEKMDMARAKAAQEARDARASELISGAVPRGGRGSKPVLSDEAKGLLESAGPNDGFGVVEATWMSNQGSRDADRAAAVSILGVESSGADFDPNAADATEVAVTDDAGRTAALASGLDVAVKKYGNDYMGAVRELSGDTKGMSDAELALWTGEVFARYAAEMDRRASEGAKNINDRLTTEASGEMYDAVLTLATRAEQNSESAFSANDAKWQSMDRKEAGSVLGGMFVKQMDSIIEKSLGEKSPEYARNAGEVYARYANSLGSSDESRLAAEDPVFKDIVDARDRFVDAGLAAIDYKEKWRMQQVADANERGMLAAFDDQGKVVEFTQDDAGMAAYRDYARAGSFDKKRIADMADQYRTDLAMLDSDVVRMKRYEIAPGQRGKAYATGPVYRTPQNEDDWDSYMDNIRTEYAGLPYMQQHAMQSAIAAKERWQETKAKELGVTVKQLKEIGMASDASETGSWAIVGGERVKYTGDTKVLRDVVKRQLQEGAGGGPMPRIPDVQFQQLADGVLIEGRGKLKAKPGHVLMFTVADDTGLLTFAYAKDDPETVQTYKDRGFFTFGENADQAGETR